MRYRLLVVAALTALPFALLAAQVLAAQDPTAPLMGAANVAPATAPVVVVNAADLAALVKAAAAAMPATPTTTTAPATVISASGLFGLPWDTLAGWLGALALMIFGLFKGASAIKARQMVVAAAEGAWHIAERAGVIYGLDGATKGALALEAFIKAMGGSVQAPQIASARVLWEAQSAKEGLAAPVPPAQLAAAQAAAKVAASGATATEIADALAKP